MNKAVIRFIAPLILAGCVFSAAAEQVRPVTDEKDMIQFTQDTFIIGEGAQTYTASRTVGPFQLSRYETTYSLWYAVRLWAEDAGYVFANPGQAGASGRRGAAPTEANGNLPVTTVTWYDVIVWCNAASEHDGLTPCYSFEGEILRDSYDTTACDLAECDWSADGYRLPTEAEWEYAARKTATGFQSGMDASGVTETRSADAVAWTDSNSQAAHIVGTAGTTPGSIQPKGCGNANGAGLFDMSGNVLEYCWDWMAEYTAVKADGFVTGPKYGSARVCRGGSWSMYTPFAGAGERYGFDPNEAYGYMGFRIARSTDARTKL